MAQDARVRQAEQREFLHSTRWPPVQAPGPQHEDRHIVALFFSILMKAMGTLHHRPNAQLRGRRSRCAVIDQADLIIFRNLISRASPAWSSLGPRFPEAQNYVHYLYMYPVVVASMNAAWHRTVIAWAMTYDNGSMSGSEMMPRARDVRGYFAYLLDLSRRCARSSVEAMLRTSCWEQRLRASAPELHWDHLLGPMPWSEWKLHLPMAEGTFESSYEDIFPNLGEPAEAANEMEYEDAADTVVMSVLTIL